jgi:putative multiple sugar transport system substrate-binding protein
MITKGDKVLVIAAIDGTTLSNALQKAADKGVKVIAYDRLIRGSKNVDYYATFDNFQVGVLQGGYIEKALDLKSGKGPFNIELFGGSPDDNNAFFFYDGAMSVLKPYIDKGKLVVRSKQMGMDKVSTLRWDGAVAQARMDNLLSAYYSGAHVDAVLSPYDGLSIGILSSLKGVGYGTPKQPMPVVTGQDAEVPSVKSIRRRADSTVFKDTRELQGHGQHGDALLPARAADQRHKTYNNGVKVVPSYLLKPVSVDVELGRSGRQRSTTRNPKSRRWIGPAHDARPSVGDRAEDSMESSWKCGASARPFRGSSRSTTSSWRCGPGRSMRSSAENGAGKSTLMKVLSGVYPHGTYTGEIRFEGVERSFRALPTARPAGSSSSTRSSRWCRCCPSRRTCPRQRAGAPRRDRLGRGASPHARPAGEGRSRRVAFHARDEPGGGQAAARSRSRRRSPSACAC